MNDPKTIQRFLEFQNLSNKEISIVADYVYLRQFDENEYIYKQNTPSSALYFLEFGTVQLLNEHREKTDRVAIVSAGRALGYSALLGDQKRKHSAQCLEKCRCLALLCNDIDHLKRSKPLLVNKILQQTIQSLLNRIHSLEKAYLDITQKLAQSDIIL